jgi:hypothetical protein
LVVWGGDGPFDESDWMQMSFDVAIATMKQTKKNPGVEPG